MSESNGAVVERVRPGRRLIVRGVEGLKLKGPGKAARRAMRGAKRLAVAVGAVGTGLLGLSVVHCTESIGLLTGSHWGLAGLLAVGIDAGMVAAELAELAAHGTKAQATVGVWARGYIVAAILLSVLLNAYAFGLHAAGGMVWAAWLLGAVIPGLVYCLGRVAGGLWLSE